MTSTAWPSTSSVWAFRKGCGLRSFVLKGVGREELRIARLTQGQDAEDRLRLQRDAELRLVVQRSLKTAHVEVEQHPFSLFATRLTCNQFIRVACLLPGLVRTITFSIRLPPPLRPGAAIPDGPYILVCPSTDPAWVPLFVQAKGLVMETGGVLSHGAIVAREFGLPAVAGLAGVHKQIKTGQRLRIDGGGGTVTILGDGAA